MKVPARAGEPGQELMGAAAGVSPDQHPAPQIRRWLPRWLLSDRVLCLVGVPGGSPRYQDGRMLMALATTNTARSRDTADSNVISIFDQCLIADTSVGLNAVAVANDMCR